VLEKLLPKLLPRAVFQRCNHPERVTGLIKRDPPDVELHLLDTGHFALEGKADEMIPLIRDFVDRKVARKCPRPYCP